VINESLTFVTTQEFNEISLKVSSFEGNLAKFETAGGTAIAITLTGIDALIDGISKTFIASANNGSAETTINSKPLYKPGTTTAPNLVAGKAYTVWYDLIGDCFYTNTYANEEHDHTISDITDFPDMSKYAFTSTSMNTETDINNFYDNCSADITPNTMYSNIVAHGVSHSILGGGTFLIEGFKLNASYEHQMVRSYAGGATGIKMFVRSKYNGAWNAWQAVYHGGNTHNHAANQITAGTLGGQVLANPTAAATLGNAQLRDICISTTDLTAGTSALTTGKVWMTYE
jgi:hypothetical protein